MYYGVLQRRQMFYLAFVWRWKVQKMELFITRTTFVTLIQTLMSAERAVIDCMLYFGVDAQQESIQPKNQSQKLFHLTVQRQHRSSPLSRVWELMCVQGVVKVSFAPIMVSLYLQ
jgi:hypothetical protein